MRTRLLVIGLAVLVGCDDKPKGDLPPLHPAKGKVVRGGQPVNGGSVRFQMEPDNPEYLGNLARARVRRGDTDDETRKLLEELVLKDDRPEWREWAQLKLYRMRQPATATRPAS